MTCCCYRAKCCIYSLLIVYSLINLFILIILLLSCYDISILNFIQKVYLILTVINWILLLCYCFYKLYLIYFGKLSEEYSPKKIWKIVHLPGFIIIGIALIYDLYKVPATSGVAGLVIYYLIFLIICAIFVIFSILDYCGIKSQIEMSLNKSERFPLNEEHELRDVSRNEKKIN